MANRSMLRRDDVAVKMAKAEEKDVETPWLNILRRLPRRERRG